MSSNVDIYTNLHNAESVQNGFAKIGVSAEQMSQRIQQNNRRMMMSFAALSTQSLGMIRLFENMAKGSVDAGEAMLQLSAYGLNFASQLMMLNMLQEKNNAIKNTSILTSAKEAITNSAVTASTWAKNAAQTVETQLYQLVTGQKTASIAASLRETASNIASSASSWAKTAALTAEAVALGVRNALSGPAGWAVIAGAAAATAGVLALTGNIPKFAGGALVYSPTQAVIGEGNEPEWVLPDSKLRQTVRETVNNSNVNKVGYSNQNITVNVYGSENADAIRLQARRGVQDALSLYDLRRKEAN